MADSKQSSSHGELIHSEPGSANAIISLLLQQHEAELSRQRLVTAVNRTLCFAGVTCGAAFFPQSRVASQLSCLFALSVSLIWVLERLAIAKSLLAIEGSLLNSVGGEWVNVYIKTKYERMPGMPKWRLDRIEPAFWLTAAFWIVIVGMGVDKSTPPRPPFKAWAHLTWEPSDRSEPGGKRTGQLSCSVELVNTGAVKVTNVIVAVSPHVEGSSDKIRLTSNRYWHTSELEPIKMFWANEPIDAGQIVPLFSVKWDVIAQAGKENKSVPAGPPPSFDLTVGGENMMRKIIRVKFDWNELKENGHVGSVGVAE